MADDRNSINIVTHRFDRFPLATYFVVPPEMLERLTDNHADSVVRQATFERLPEMIVGQLVYSMQCWLLKSQHVKKRVLSTISTPATWWDHLKHDLAASPRPFWRWAASKLSSPRYAVEQKTAETQIRVCPHNDYYFSERPNRHIEFLEWNVDIAREKKEGPI